MKITIRLLKTQSLKYTGNFNSGMITNVNNDTIVEIIIEKIGLNYHIMFANNGFLIQMWCDDFYVMDKDNNKLYDKEDLINGLEY